MNPGMVHLYIGDGKGKTTAALGLLMRAYGAGLSCLFVQFLKGMPTGELETLRRLQIPVLRTDDVRKFIASMSPEEQEACRQSHTDCFGRLVCAVSERQPDCIVLDEVLDAVSLGMIPEEKLIALIETCRGRTELILTGRDPGKAVVELADYITEMKKLRHPYEQGVEARKGIEY